MCKGILKILMVIFNTAIFAAGVASLVIGIRVINDKNVFGWMDESINKVEELSEQLAYLFSAGYLLVAVGAVVTLIGFLGCCGALCENQCMLMAFFNIMLVAFVVEVAAVILVLYHKPKVEKLLLGMQVIAKKTIQEGYGKNEVLTNMWNKTMTLLKCCGYNNYTDFDDSEYVKTTLQYPEFCCSSEKDRCDPRLGHHPSSPENVNGCFTVVEEWLKKNSAFLQGIAICVAAIEVGSMIMSFILIRRENFNPADVSCALKMFKPI